MPRTIQAFQPVAGEPPALQHAFLGDPAGWLPGSERTVDGQLLVTVHGGGLTRKVEAEVGAPWSTGHTTWRSLSWAPGAEAERSTRVARLLPVFDGELALHLLGDAATLAIDARYQPPGGQLGAAIDGIALHRVARGTVGRLLGDIATALAGLAGADAEAPTTSRGAPHLAD